LVAYLKTWDAMRENKSRATLYRTDPAAKPNRHRRAAAVSSTSAAFCCVMPSIWITAWLICLMPAGRGGDVILLKHCSANLCSETRTDTAAGATPFRQPGVHAP
jgi:hypothetical protein